MNKILSGIIIVATSLALSSCKSVDVTGNKVNEADISYIKAHKPTKEQVIERLGSPSIQPDYSPDTWYYVYIKTNKTTWTFPKIIEQRILKITFDSSSRVASVAILEDTYNNEVHSVSQTTPTPGTEESPLQEFVKNIGRFGKSKKKKR